MYLVEDNKRILAYDLKNNLAIRADIEREPLARAVDPRGSLRRKEVYVVDYDPERLYIYGFDGTIKFETRGIVAPTMSFDEKILINYCDDRVLGLIFPHKRGGYFIKKYPKFSN